MLYKLLNVPLVMGKAIVTLKIMPSSPDVDLEAVSKTTQEFINEFTGGSEIRTKVEPLAFGLNSLSITFVMDESLGEVEPLQQKINDIEGVNSAEIVDMRRALG